MAEAEVESGVGRDKQHGFYVLIGMSLAAKKNTRTVLYIGIEPATHHLNEKGNHSFP